MIPNYKPWTLPERERLRAVYADQSVRATCLEFDRTRYSVESTARVLGLPSKHANAEYLNGRLVELQKEWAE